MSSSEVSRLMGVIKEPWWKFWVTQGKREQAAKELVKLGKVAVPALIKEYMKDPTTSGLLYEALANLGEVGTEALAEAARQAHHPHIMLKLAGVFEEMGPSARAAIPLLLKWARLRGDPRREMMRHLTGNAALDHGISQAAGMSSESPEELTFFTWVRQAAVAALIKMGPALAPHVGELRALRKNETDEICRDRLDSAIKAAGG